MKKATKLLIIVLFVAILVSLFAVTAIAASSAITQERQFNELEQAIYDELKSYVISVANGSTSCTTFTITSDISSLSWTKSELGCTIYANGAITSEAKATLKEKLKEDLNFSYIHQCLLADLPYELFWYDKTVGISYNYKMQGNSSKLWITSLTISFTVSGDYRPSNATNYYVVDPAQITRANNAAALAKEIVAKYDGKSDLEKLQAYKEEICSLVTYNSAATEDEGGHTSGDPWQLVYVFDGDPNTNVVCEGYSKAFKYLCDLSSFDKDIYCYITTGTLSTGDSSEGHMWNVVQINNNNYLVDVTNCDSITGKSSSHLFLVGGIVSNAGQTHIISESGNKNSLKYTYTYRESQIDIYCDGYLVLSETSYLDSYHEHSFSATWMSDGTQHWRECSCGEKSDTSTHTSTTSPASCTQRAICDVCGAEHGELLPHSYVQQVTSQTYLKSSATCTDNAVYYYSCQCGAKATETFTVAGFATHKFTQKDVTPQALKSVATCTKAATYYYSCSCGEIGEATFYVGEPIGHTYSQQNIDDRYLKSRASCSDSAVYYYSCSCGAMGSTTFDYGTILEHRYNELGECTLCGYSIPIPPPKDNESDGDNNEGSATPPESSDPGTEKPSKDTTPENNSVENNSPSKHNNETLKDISIVALICVVYWTLLIIFIKSNQKKQRKD